MRNWNSLFSDGAKPSLKCFYSTYEELKPPRFHSIIALPFRFYSTYEELKHSINKAWYYYNVSFYSTYEELKHKNNKTYATNKEAFLQYLWGIETRDKIILIQDLYVVFTVPMRNWNSIAIIGCPNFGCSFYSTYEELKLLLSYVSY